MSPFIILFIGMAVVVGGIVGLRLHAFIALILAALVVSWLATPETIYQSQFTPAERVELAKSDDLNSLGPKLAQKHLEAQSKSKSSFISRVVTAFGGGCGKVAIIIAMAAIIGKCLLDSGAAERVVLSLRSLFGKKGTPVAFSASAFTLGIPVFFDTVFYLLMPLGKAMRMKEGKNYLLYILTIVSGATMAHSLVPPTPGPLTVVGFFGGDVTIGEMILGGLCVGLVTVTVGYFYAAWANKRWEIPLRPSAELSEEELEAMANRDPKTLPPLLLSLLPILLPVILIAGHTAVDAFGTVPAWLAVIGDKNMALIISAFVALILLAIAKRESFRNLSGAVQSALSSGGVIILITAAGSAFGGVLRETGIADSVAALVPDKQSLVLIPIAFLITAAVRTAQGSATVAMITAGGIIAPIVGAVDLSFHPLYLALAIGCGSKPIMWANDSGFWIIGRMSGMTPVETFKTVSVMMILMALSGLAVVMIGALVLPMR